MRTKSDILEMKYDLLFYLVIGAYFLYLLDLTADLSPDAALTPRVSLLVGLFLCGIGLVKLLVIPSGFIQGWNTDPRSLRERADAPTDDDGEGDDRSLPYPVTVALYVIGVVAFVLSIAYVGFFTTTFGFTFAHSLFRGKGLLKSLLAAVLLPAAFYVLFIVVLGRTLILRHGFLI